MQDTQHHVAHEAANHAADHPAPAMSTRQVFAETSLRNPSLSAASQAGLVNNLNDGMAWGLLPLVFAAAGLSVSRIGILAAVYPAVWGLGQLATGAISDRVGRNWMLAWGMCTQSRRHRPDRHRRQLRLLAGRRHPPRHRNRHGLPHPPRRRR